MVVIKDIVNIHGTMRNNVDEIFIKFDTID